MNDIEKIPARFGQRGALSSVWDGVNPVLENGEIGIESDTSLYKIGDGITHWRELEYEYSVVKAFTPMYYKDSKSVGGLTIQCGNAESKDKMISGAIIPTKGVGIWGTGENSVIFNDYIDNKAIGDYSLVIGKGTVAEGSKSFAGGNGSTAQGENSFAFGLSVCAPYDNQVAFGQYNNAWSDNPENKLFSLGNGTQEQRSDAFVVYKDGSVKIAKTQTLEDIHEQELVTYGLLKGKINEDGSHETFITNYFSNNGTNKIPVLFNIAADNVSQHVSLTTYLQQQEYKLEESKTETEQSITTLTKQINNLQEQLDTYYTDLELERGSLVISNDTETFSKKVNEKAIEKLAVLTLDEYEDTIISPTNKFKIYDNFHLFSSSNVARYIDPADTGVVCNERGGMTFKHRSYYSNLQQSSTDISNKYDIIFGDLLSPTAFEEYNDLGSITISGTSTSVGSYQGNPAANCIEIIVGTWYGKDDSRNDFEPGYYYLKSFTEGTNDMEWYLSYRVEQVGQKYNNNGNLIPGSNYILSSSNARQNLTEDKLNDYKSDTSKMNTTEYLQIKIRIQAKVTTVGTIQRPYTIKPILCKITEEDYNNQVYPSVPTSIDEFTPWFASQLRPKITLIQSLNKSNTEVDTLINTNNQLYGKQSVIQIKPMGKIIFHSEWPDIYQIKQPNKLFYYAQRS